MATDTYSFSAGPATLPEAVRAQIREDLRDWHGTGRSILETSQWDPRLLEMFEHVEADLRDLLEVPDGYTVLFLHGGASNQFSMVPMNLLRGRDRADYVHTGMWSGKAIDDAGRYASVNIAATTAESGFGHTPAQGELHLDPRAAYVHYTPVETADGVQFGYVPETGGVPLVADATAALLAMPLDIGRHAVVYASTQKNLGVVGMTVVIVRTELIGQALPGTPTTFDYAVHERTRSRFTTPPIFAWYVTGLILQWVRDHGGVPATLERSRRRAEIVYSAVDASSMFTAPVEHSARAWTNVIFTMNEPALAETLLEEAEKAGLHDLPGHSRVGGFRASLYLGMPTVGAEALAAYLADFERRHG
ncbi:phosphoserine transaminase [Nocardioidaceae bacterium Broad-1]|nr:phosphoserine transaminase [Nocardioidaceae bacterium Broad-1]